MATCVALASIKTAQCWSTGPFFMSEAVTIKGYRFPASRQRHEEMNLLLISLKIQCLDSIAISARKGSHELG